MFRSLRLKLIVVLLALHGVSFSLMAYFNYQMSTQKLTDEMERNMRGNLTTAARNLDDWLNLRQTEGSLLARSDNVRSGTTEDKLAFLSQLTARTKDYVRIGIGDRNGTMRLTDGSTIEMHGMYAYRAALNGVSNIADPRKKTNPDEPNLLWTFVPIFDLSRQVSGVLGLALDSDAALKQHLYFDSFDYKDYTITLLDRSTTLLYHSNESDMIGYNYHDNTPNSKALFDLIQRQNYGHGDQFIRGRTLKVYFAHVPNTNWIITYSVNRAEFMQPLRSSLSWTLALVALTELLLGILLFAASDIILMKRLKRILSQTEQVASGDLHLSPLPTGSRDELGALSVSVNRMTENLRDLFEPFHTFIKHNDFAMLVVDTRFVITSFNDRAVKLLGYSAAEVIGTRSLLRWHDPDQIKERAKSYSEKLGTTVPNDETALFILSQRGYLPEWEWIWIDRDGARIPVSLNTSIMKHSDGSTKGYVVIARDVTEIKSAADTNVRLLEIMESAHDMIASFDFRGRIFYLNQQGRKFMDIGELNEQTELLSRYMNVTTTFQFANGLKTARDKGFWQGEVEMVRADGLSFVTSMIVVAHAPKDGGEPFFSTIVRDISEQKEIEREIVHAKQAADEANEAKSSFLARMSHEIRTPLSGIIGLTQLLRRSELSELQHEYLEQIGLSSQSLLQMLNEVLDFSKLEADKLSIEKVRFLPEESLQKLTATFAVLLGSNPVDFIVNVDPKLPAAWIGDPARLEQVLLNLGSNAVKFTKQGIIELRIEPAPPASSSGGSEEPFRVKFTVSDTGIGMTEEQISRLFQPFVQADDKTSRKYGGTGLGLVISKALIENMGGSISVRSEHGVGSSFSFELPFGLPEDGAAPLGEASEPLGLQVLVLEDDSRMLGHWRSMLESFGCEVATSSRWIDALSLLESRAWDVLLVDMEIGDMHGEETWAEWKRIADSRGVRIVSFTSLPGRDALLRLPESLKPAAVMMMPIAPGQLRKCFLSLQRNDQGNGQRKIPDLSAAVKFQGLVLVVDDQPVNRLVAGELLSQYGVQALTAESGDQAIKMVKQHSFSLLFMDLHMPEMDGLETTARIRADENGRNVPIVALTADTMPEQRSRCLKAGMNEVLLKPILPERLLEVLYRWMPPPLSAQPQIAAGAEWIPPRIEGLDVQTALRRLDGKWSLYVKLLHTFREQYVDCADRLRMQLEAGDDAGAVKLLHSLRGAAGHLGAFDLQHSATLLEQSIEKQPNEPDSALLRLFEEQLKTVVFSIQNMPPDSEFDKKDVRRTQSDTI